MLTKGECIPCMLNQGLKMAVLTGMNESGREKMLRDILGFLHGEPWGRTPPDMAREIYRIMEGHTGIADPYESIKKKYNREIGALEGDLGVLLDKADFAWAVKMAISGNIIDFGTHHRISRQIILNQIETIESKPLMRDDSSALARELTKADSLLYLGDNCGEIVFDKLFISYLKKRYPRLEITYAVRGAPIINDVTRVDAEETGLDRLVRIIDNGDDSPGTVLERTSALFRAEYDRADVIIAKGQGNYESLGDETRNGLYFLFMAKCGPVAQSLEVPAMSLICSRNT